MYFILANQPDSADTPQLQSKGAALSWPQPWRKGVTFLSHSHHFYITEAQSFSFQSLCLWIVMLFLHPRKSSDQSFLSPSSVASSLPQIEIFIPTVYLCQSIAQVLHLSYSSLSYFLNNNSGMLDTSSSPYLSAHSECSPLFLNPWFL